MIKFKKLLCKHDYQPWANIHGDLAKDLNARTVFQCRKCGKRIFKKEYVEAPLKYNKFLEWAYYMKEYKKTKDPIYEIKANKVLTHMYKDISTYIEVFINYKDKT